MGNDVNKLKQRLEIRKYLVFAGMFLLFLGAMWLIFAPSEEEKRKEEKNAGFNTELPDPRGAGIEGDKIAAYELAARYMPGNGGVNTDSRSDNESPGRNGKAKAVPVGLVSTPVVSSLPQPVSDSIQLTGMAQPERFHTPIGNKEERNVRNTIRACIHGDQTVISGQGVRMRLLEPMRVGKHILPKNSLLTGEGRIQGERLHVNILQVEYGGIIIPVELAVYDNDGQGGIFIPGSMEANAVREVAANLGQNLGTSISITNQSAGDQLLSELGRGAIQGVSQYITKKLREEKVHLKSGHTLMLYQNDNQ